MKAVFVHIEPIDFRKGINGLGAEVDESFGSLATGVNLFVFSNRRKDKVKILYWDDTGFVLWQKALEKDRFSWPKKAGQKAWSVSAEQLRWLLSGLRIDDIAPHEKISAATQFF